MTATMRMRLPGRATRSITPTVGVPVPAATAPPERRYRAQQLPESDRWSIYDSEELGEVANCPSGRVEGLLAALNGQDMREKASDL